MCLTPALAQKPAPQKAKTDSGKYQLHPTHLKTSPTRVYIPKDLQDTFTELDKMLSPALRAEMRAGAEKEMFRYHFGLGMWIRNNWGLWKGLRLAKWFNQEQILVPDDMSGIIFVSYWRYLHHQPIAFEDQVKATLAYWERAKIAATKEKQRVEAAKATIRGMMMNLQVTEAPTQTVLFPARPLDDVRVRYMAPFAGGILITAKIALMYGFLTECYFLDLTTMRLHPVRLPEMDHVKQCIVIQDHAYFYGLKQGRDTLLDLHGKERVGLPVPPEKGFLRLGMETSETGEKHLLVVRPHSVSRWNGQWQLLYQAKDPLPDGALPPQRLGLRLYFRDEGLNEDDKRLSWLEGPTSNAPIYFDEHVGLVGSEGPRWENVWSYVQTPDRALRLTPGSIISSPSLLRWDQSKGYQIALFNDSTTFQGDLLGEDSRENASRQAFAATGLEARADNGVHVIGPHGLISVLDHRLTPLLRFQQTPRDWIPTHLLTLNANAFLVGGHFGGVYLFRKGAEGSYHVFPLKKKQGRPKTL